MTRKACRTGLDHRCRDLNGEIRHKNGSTRVDTLRETYGPRFAEGSRGDMKLDTLLGRTNSKSLTDYLKKQLGSRSIVYAQGRTAMACALTRFGRLCRDLRHSKNQSMGDQAAVLECEVHYVSAVETGKIEPTSEYIEKFSQWLQLYNIQYDSLKKRSKANVLDLRQRFSTSNSSTSMRLFRKVSKMGPTQIRRLGTKIQGEAENDRRFSGPIEIS